MKKIISLLLLISITPILTMDDLQKWKMLLSEAQAKCTYISLDQVPLSMISEARKFNTWVTVA